MATETQYIDFELDGLSKSGKTKVWFVRSRRSGLRLGTVMWHGPWRQYVFRPNGNTIFNKGCLRVIAEFTARETERKRNPEHFEHVENRVAVEGCFECFPLGHRIGG